jgi:hypothetical protein
MDGKRWEQATTQIYTQRAGGRPIRISDLFRISDFGLRILAGLGVTNLNRDLAWLTVLDRRPELQRVTD